MTGNNNSSKLSGMQDNITISRKIHQQMMNKKNRWRPSELELALLKLHFQKNQYPSKEEKEAIVSTLERQFGTKVHIDQLSRWFQHEREKALARSSKIVCKNTYRKFGKEELEYLQESFTKNNYPKMDEMIAMAKKLNVNLSKIENWYKHNRRTLAKRGHFSLKTKKYFKKEELSYLVEMFENHPRPTKDQFIEMADKLNCTECQIKNWYSNKRKKHKLIAKKQCYESTDTSYPSLDQSMFSKGSLYTEAPSIPLQIPIIAPTLPIQLPVTSPKENEAKPFTSPLMLSNPTTISQQAQPFFGGYTNGGIPILIVPTTVSNSSSMIVNTNIINNTTPNSIPNLNNDAFASARELKSPYMFQDSRTIVTPELEKAKLMTPPPIISPFTQTGAIGAYPQKVFFPNTPSYIPINTPSTSNSFENIQSPWSKSPIQPQKMDFEFVKKIQPNLGSGQPSLSMMGPMMSPKLDLNRGLGGHMIPINAGNGLSFISGTGNNTGIILPESNLKQLSSMAPSPKPLQVQYQTSLYMPFGNNNIYNQYPPMMLQSGSEVCLQSPMQPQMHMNTFIPAGSIVSSHQK